VTTSSLTVVAAGGAVVWTIASWAKADMAGAMATASAKAPHETCIDRRDFTGETPLAGDVT
jgi:hypothetical protein